MITLSLDINKLDKKLMRPGKAGQLYATFSLHEKSNDYGDDGYVAQSVSKEERLAGKKGPIVGNYRDWKTAPKKEDNTPWD